MSTRTFDRHYVESSRVIEIVADDRDLWRPDPELESEPLVVATITSSGDVQGEQSPNVPFVRSHPWTPPSVRFERNDRTLTRYTRAQWEELKPLDEPERELMRQELAPVPCPPAHHCPNVAVMRIAFQPFGPWQNISAECLETFQAAYEKRGEPFPWHLSSLALAAREGQP